MSEICSVIQRKAKKIHFCDVCGKPIIPDSEYLAIRSAEDGRFWHNKEHIHCDALLDAYTRQTGLGLDFGRMDMVVTWLCAKACSECSHESSSLEDKSIQKIHKMLGVETVKPLKSKVEILKEYGYPILSKEIAGKISHLQNPTENNATVRHAIITGETGAYGGNRTNTRMKMSQKWLDRFGGADPEGAALGYKAAAFKVSDRCCYFLKEKPCDDWAKAHNSVPYLGLMASEGGRREKSLMMNGCNYFGKSTIRSAPFAIFSRQDLLQLALDLNVPVPEIYGEIVRDEDGTLRTTGAQRTGCSMCGFGVHLEKRPHRFDRLRKANPKEWHFWMYDQGWGQVLDYIGVGWEDEV